MPLNPVVVFHIAAAALGQHPMGTPDMPLLQEVSSRMVLGAPTPQRIDEYAAHAFGIINAGQRACEHFV